MISMGNTRKINFEDVKNFIEQKVPFFRRVGIVVESIAAGKIKLAISFDPNNLNHLGTYQAGVYMTLAEAAGGALLATILDLSDTLLLTKECQLKFGEPAKNYLSYEGTMDINESDEIIKRLEDKRKVDVPINVILLNEAGRKAAEAVIIYYLRADSAAIINAHKRPV